MEILPFFTLMLRQKYINLTFCKFYHWKHKRFTFYKIDYLLTYIDIPYIIIELIKFYKVKYSFETYKIQSKGLDSIHNLLKMDNNAKVRVFNPFPQDSMYFYINESVNIKPYFYKPSIRFSLNL